MSEFDEWYRGHPTGARRVTPIYGPGDEGTDAEATDDNDASSSKKYSALLTPIKQKIIAAGKRAKRTQRPAPGGRRENETQNGFCVQFTGELINFLAYQGDVGADFRVGPGVLSTDVIAGHSKDAVSVAIVGPTDAVGHPVNIFTPGFANAFMSATLSDNTNVMVDAKYTIGQLKLYAGWEWIQQKNPSDPFTVLHDGFTDIAGDFLCFQCTLIDGTTINSTAFNGGNKLFQIAWFGGTYALLPTLDLTTAYYREWQNDFSGGAKNVAGGTCALATTALPSCTGTLDAVSVVLDWRFAPKWDAYIGTLYSRLNGGLDSGFQAKDNWSTTGGVRFRW